MQKYILVNGFIGDIPCIKVVSASGTVVDIVFEQSATYVSELTDIIRKYKISFSEGWRTNETDSFEWKMNR